MKTRETSKLYSFCVNGVGKFFNQRELREVGVVSFTHTISLTELDTKGWEVFWVPDVTSTINYFRQKSSENCTWISVKEDVEKKIKETRNDWSDVIDGLNHDEFFYPQITTHVSHLIVLDAIFSFYPSNLHEAYSNNNGFRVTL